MKHTFDTRDRIALALVLVSPVLFLWPMLSKPYTPEFIGAGDAWHAVGPSAFFLDYSLHRHHELPLWNPLVFCGTPFAANPGDGVFYPVHLLRGLLNCEPTPFRTHVSLMVQLLLHMALSAGCVLLFARRQGLNLGASVVAALGFTFSAPMLFGVTRHWAMVEVMCWLPLVFSLLEAGLSATETRRRITYAILAGVAFSMMLLIGSPQITFLAGYLLASFVLFRGTIDISRRRKEGAIASVHEHNGLCARMAHTSTVALIMLVVCFLLGAVIFLPAAELAGLSERARASNTPLTLRGNEYSVNALLALLFTYGGMEKTGYFKMGGLSITLLALASLWHPQRLRVLLFALLFYIMLDCALGPPMPMATLFEWLIPMRIAVPSRAMLVAMFPLAILAGYGVDALTMPSDWIRGRGLGYGLTLLTGMFVLAALIVRVSSDPFHEVPIGVLFVPLAVIPVAIAAQTFRMRGISSLLMTGVLLMELILWSPRYLAFYLNDHLRLPSMDTLRPPADFWSDNRRGYEERHNTNLYQLRGVMSGYLPLHDSRVYQVLCGEGHEGRYQRITNREILTDNHRGQLFLKRPFWLAREYVPGPLPPKDALFPPTTTVFLPDARNLPVPSRSREEVVQHSFSENSKRTRLIRKQQFARMTIHPGGTPEHPEFYHHLPVTFEKPPEHSALLLEIKVRGTMQIAVSIKSYDTGAAGEHSFLRTYTLSDEVLTAHELEYPLPDYGKFRMGFTVRPKSHDWNVEFHHADLVVDGNDEDALLEVTSRKANSVQVEVRNLPESRVLVFTDAYYNGWLAYLDGKRVPIYLANDAFKAVVIPQGTHRIRFVFRSWRVYAGVAVSMTSLAVCAFFVGWLQLRACRNRSVP